jgi:hypothetical protein
MLKDIFIEWVLPGLGTLMAGVIVRYIHAWTKKLGIEMTLAQDAWVDKLVKEGIATAEERFAAIGKGPANTEKQRIVVSHVQSQVNVSTQKILDKTHARLAMTPGVGATEDKAVFNGLDVFSPKGGN